MLSRLVTIGLLAVSTGLTAGCGGEFWPPEDIARSRDRGNRLAQLINDHASEHGSFPAQLGELGIPLDDLQPLVGERTWVYQVEESPEGMNYFLLTVFRATDDRFAPQLLTYSSRSDEWQLSDPASGK